MNINDFIYKNIQILDFRGVNKEEFIVDINEITKSKIFLVFNFYFDKQNITTSNYLENHNIKELDLYKDFEIFYLRSYSANNGFFINQETEFLSKTHSTREHKSLYNIANFIENNCEHALIREYSLDTIVFTLFFKNNKYAKVDVTIKKAV